MSNYTDQTKLQGWLKRKLTSDEAVYVGSLLSAVDNYIDRETGVSWKSGQVGEQRIYPGGGQMLWLDPVSDITSVEWINRYGDTVFSYTDGTDYQAWPLNQSTKTYLKKLLYIDEFDTDSEAGKWPSVGQGIRVTGTYGEAGGVPGDITLAATILAADWLHNQNPLRLEMIEGYRREYWEPSKQNPQVETILASRRRILL